MGCGVWVWGCSLYILEVGVMLIGGVGMVLGVEN